MLGGVETRKRKDAFEKIRSPLFEERCRRVKKERVKKSTREKIAFDQNALSLPLSFSFTRFHLSLAASLSIFERKSSSRRQSAWREKKSEKRRQEKRKQKGDLRSPSIVAAFFSFFFFFFVLLLLRPL